mmetsp:Transcript_27196/g.63545  ORF Transcript_27196/g.63545 Transcript_27196/m.63545 type:complete len:245 (+) Transcript_27196:211-945(+)
MPPARRGGGGVLRWQQLRARAARRAGVWQHHQRPRGRHEAAARQHDQNRRPPRQRWRRGGFPIGRGGRPVKEQHQCDRRGGGGGGPAWVEGSCGGARSQAARRRSFGPRAAARGARVPRGREAQPAAAGADGRRAAQSGRRGAESPRQAWQVHVDEGDVANGCRRHLRHRRRALRPRRRRPHTHWDTLHAVRARGDCDANHLRRRRHSRRARLPASSPLLLPPAVEPRERRRARPLPRQLVSQL